MWWTYNKTDSTMWYTCTLCIMVVYSDTVSSVEPVFIVTYLRRIEPLFCFAFWHGRRFLVRFFVSSLFEGDSNRSLLFRCCPNQHSGLVSRSYARARACVCVCVCERERDRQTDRQTETERKRVSVIFLRVISQKAVVRFLHVLGTHVCISQGYRQTWFDRELT